MFIGDRDDLLLNVACVRRRAALSVAANLACPDHAAAERAVNESGKLFNDSRPFDEGIFPMSISVIVKVDHK